MTLADDRARRVGAHTEAGSRSTPIPGGATFSLDDRYTRESGTIYLTGI
ncbi:hypothetical protein G3I15_29355, partial [Streptomyces sp. SID10244]|nr:hypothetical protein [Streptomyces sp. SID10244]